MKSEVTDRNVDFFYEKNVLGIGQSISEKLKPTIEATIFRSREKRRKSFSLLIFLVHERTATRKTAKSRNKSRRCERRSIPWKESEFECFGLVVATKNEKKNFFIASKKKKIELWKWSNNLRPSNNFHRSKKAKTQSTLLRFDKLRRKSLISTWRRSPPNWEKLKTKEKTNFQLFSLRKIDFSLRTFFCLTKSRVESTKKQKQNEKTQNFSSFHRGTSFFFCFVCFGAELIERWKSSYWSSLRPSLSTNSATKTIFLFLIAREIFLWSSRIHATKIKRSSSETIFSFSSIDEHFDGKFSAFIQRSSIDK